MSDGKMFDENVVLDELEVDEIEEVIAPGFLLSD